MTAAPLFETPVSKHRSEQWERLTDMAANTEGWWDFSVSDIAALDWSRSEILRLLAENARLRWGLK